jgi:hypothetical protein
MRKAVFDIPCPAAGFGQVISDVLRNELLARSYLNHKTPRITSLSLDKRAISTPAVARVSFPFACH